jgi:23S rRNA (uracil1939-C5)-methyltransferase
MARRTRKKRLPEPVSHIAIDSLAHDGRGVAHLDGKAVFIEGALPGEQVGFEYLVTHGKFDEGRVTDIHQAAPDRAIPKCIHFGVCGGCSLQHLSPEAQIAAKQQVLIDNLERIGGVSPQSILPPLTGPVWGYRNKARLGVKDVQKKGRVLVGFREKHASFIADLTRCEVLHPAAGERIDKLARLVESMGARARIPQIEVAVSDSVMALVFRHLDPLSEADEVRLAEFAASGDIHVWLQSGGPDTLRPFAPVDSDLSYHLPGQSVEIRFRPTDFIQVNPAINAQMVTRVLTLLELSGDDHVLDLFCGLGNFTLPMARQAGDVTGVEGEAGLVARARDNAMHNRLNNVTFEVANLATDCRDAAWTGRAYNKILLDPPRSGAAGVLDLLGNMHPQRIVYVSCHPGSLARDAAVLVKQHGYTLVKAGVMDMFPHTAHVESIALFEG